VAAFDGAGLRADRRRAQERGKEEDREDFSHRVVSFNFFDAVPEFPVQRRYRNFARKANFFSAAAA
jgi:hypothetical protein